ncbi:hypothetical protein C8J56DRAFT_902723 [Mycena floridula]|nr:hypothetical protein C8J56DRAFT_902723 [Mycena floridula]
MKGHQLTLPKHEDSSIQKELNDTLNPSRALYDLLVLMDYDFCWLETCTGTNAVLLRPRRNAYMQTAGMSYELGADKHDHGLYWIIMIIFVFTSVLPKLTDVGDSWTSIIYLDSPHQRDPVKGDMIPFARDYLTSALQSNMAIVSSPESQMGLQNTTPEIDEDPDEETIFGRAQDSKEGEMIEQLIWEEEILLETINDSRQEDMEQFLNMRPANLVPTMYLLQDPESMAQDMTLIREVFGYQFME